MSHSTAGYVDRLMQELDGINYRLDHGMWEDGQTYAKLLERKRVLEGALNTI